MPEKNNILTIVFQGIREYRIVFQLLFQIELVRGERDPLFGLQMEAELADDVDQENELRVHQRNHSGVAYLTGKVDESIS